MARPLNEPSETRNAALDLVQFSGLDFISELRHRKYMTPLTRRSPVSLDICHLFKAIEVIGDRWTLLILRSALFGVRRFDDFQTELGTPRTILSGRLKRLVDAGIMTKESYRVPGKRPRPEYVLTEMGQALQPILIAMTQWGDEWLGDGAQPPLGFTHAKKRQKVRASFVDEDGLEAGLADMRISLRR